MFYRKQLIATHCNTPLCSEDFTRESVLNKLKQLNPSKSTGPDSLHPPILKELAEELAKPLAQFFFLPSHLLRESPKALGKMQMLPHLLKKGTKATLEITAQSAEQVW